LAGLNSSTFRYSCSDIICLAKETIMQPLREIIKATHFRPVETLPSGETVYEPCQANDEGAKEMDFMSLSEKQLKIRPIGMVEISI